MSAFIFKKFRDKKKKGLDNSQANYSMSWTHSIRDIGHVE